MYTSEISCRLCFVLRIFISDIVEICKSNGDWRFNLFLRNNFSSMDKSLFWLATCRAKGHEIGLQFGGQINSKKLAPSHTLALHIALAIAVEGDYTQTAYSEPT